MLAPISTEGLTRADVADLRERTRDTIDAARRELQRELAVTEDRIQAARRLFNGNVRDYNQRVQSVPSNIVAAVASFRRRDYFELEAAVRDAGPPRVETS